MEKTPMRQYILALLTLALGIAVLVHLILIAIHGAVLIQEPNRACLLGEISLVSLIIIYSLWNLIEALIKKRRL